MTGIFSLVPTLAILFSAVIANTSCASVADKKQTENGSASHVSGTSVATPTLRQSPTAMMPQVSMPMMGGWHHSSEYGCLYFTGSEVSVSGSVQSSGPVIPKQGMMQGSQVILKTTQKSYVIHLGPSWYIEQQNFHLKAGDSVTVVGRLIGTGDSSFIMASQIQMGDRSLNLRDASGIPNWAGVRGHGKGLIPQACPMIPRR